MDAPDLMNAMTSLTLLVLAAGLGSRYGGLKQIDSVGPNGETILDYSIYDAIRAGFRKVVFVIRKDIEVEFKQAIGSRFRDSISVEYAFQELDNIPPGFTVPSGRTRPWGTAHAILAAANAIVEPFAVINADDFYGTNSYGILAQHLKSGTSVNAMVGFVLRNTLSNFGAVSRGLCQLGDMDLLQSIVELKRIELGRGCITNTEENGTAIPLSGDEIVSMNMWGFTPSIFEQLHQCFENFLVRSGSDIGSESYLPGAINELLSAKQVQVKVLFTPDSWCGVTYRGDRPSVVEHIGRLIHNGEYPERLWP